MLRRARKHRKTWRYASKGETMNGSSRIRRHLIASLALLFGVFCKEVDASGQQNIGVSDTQREKPVCSGPEKVALGEKVKYHCSVSYSTRARTVLPIMTIMINGVIQGKTQPTEPGMVEQSIEIIVDSSLYGSNVECIVEFIELQTSCSIPITIEGYKVPKPDSVNHQHHSPHHFIWKFIAIVSISTLAVIIVVILVSFGVISLALWLKYGQSNIRENNQLHIQPNTHQEPQNRRDNMEGITQNEIYRPLRGTGTRITHSYSLSRLDDVRCLDSGLFEQAINPAYISSTTTINTSICSDATSETGLVLDHNRQPVRYARCVRRESKHDRLEESQQSLTSMQSEHCNRLYLSSQDLHNHTPHNTRCVAPVNIASWSRQDGADGLQDSNNRPVTMEQWMTDERVNDTELLKTIIPTSTIEVSASIENTLTSTEHILTGRQNIANQSQHKVPKNMNLFRCQSEPTIRHPDSENSIEQRWSLRNWCNGSDNSSTETGELNTSNMNIHAGGLSVQRHPRNKREFSGEYCFNVRSQGDLIHIPHLGDFTSVQRSTLLSRPELEGAVGGHGLSNVDSSTDSVTYVQRSNTNDSAMASVFDPNYMNRDGFHVDHIVNNLIYAQLQEIPWVLGYHSAGRSISVYADLSTHDANEVQQQLVNATGQPANKFKLQHK